MTGIVVSTGARKINNYENTEEALTLDKRNIEM